VNENEHFFCVNDIQPLIDLKCDTAFRTQPPDHLNLGRVREKEKQGPGEWHKMCVPQGSKIESDCKLHGEERGKVEKMLNILGARLTFMSTRGPSDERQHIPRQEDTRNMDMEVSCIRFRPSDLSIGEALLSSTQ